MKIQQNMDVQNNFLQNQTGVILAYEEEKKNAKEKVFSKSKDRSNGSHTCSDIIRSYPGTRNIVYESRHGGRNWKRPHGICLCL